MFIVHTAVFDHHLP